MKKRAAYLVLAILILAVSLGIFASAQQVSETEKVESAYLWLIQQTSGKWSTLDMETMSLSLLALGYDDLSKTDGKAAILSKKHATLNCFPSTGTGCRSLDTAFAILALNHIGEPVDAEAEWLLSKEVPFKVGGISWLLQVDSPEATNCTIKYDSKEYPLSIKKDRSYSWTKSTPSCISLTEMNYWLKISTSCLDKAYSVTCEDSASVSLPYKLDTTLYVPSETFLTPTDVSINTVCLAEGASCSYEATLWGAYALMKSGKEYTQFLPYLIGESESKRRSMPVDSILYLLTSKEEHAAKAIADQSRDGFWTDVGGRGKYWDTAMASLGLADYAQENVTKARAWLLKNQNTEGSFGTTYKMKDTALVLSSLWPRGVAVGLNDCQDIYNYMCKTSCASDEEKVSYSCSLGVCCKPEGTTPGCSKVEDCTKADCKGQFVADIFGRRGQCELKESLCDDNFDNDNDGLIDMDDTDCSVTCLDLGGIECEANEDCDVSFKKALGTARCCVGTCVPAESLCSEKNGVLCSTSQTCEGNQVSASDAVDKICCDGSCKTKRAIWPWILLMILLLAAGGLYYSYKKGHLDKYIEKFSKYFKKNVKTAYAPPIRPYAPDQTPPGPFMPQRRPFTPASTSTQSSTARRSDTRTESELKDTIEKLKKYAGR